MRPTKRHFIATTAALASAAESAELEQFDEYEKMLHLLARHKKDLSNIQSMEKRAEYKKQILPDYLPWIEGALKAGTGKQDNVLMMWQVWAIDCGEYHLALEIADYAVHQQLKLPEQFDRTLGTMLAEETFELAYLQRVQDITQDEDMLDQSRARLLREIGLLLAESDPENALATMERALQLDINIGLKGEVKKLRKQLNKPDDDKSEKAD